METNPLPVASQEISPIMDAIRKVYPAVELLKGIETSPNLWDSSRSLERPIKSQSSVYWNNAEARTSTSNVPLKACYEIHYPTLSNL